MHSGYNIRTKCTSSLYRGGIGNDPLKRKRRQRPSRAYIVGWSNSMQIKCSTLLFHSGMVDTQVPNGLFLCASLDNLLLAYMDGEVHPLCLVLLSFIEFQELA